MRVAAAALLLLGATTAAARASLPAPDGPYAVGMQSFELTDPSRQGIVSRDPGEPRVIPGYVWYPASPASRGTRAYLTAAEVSDQGRSMARNFGYGVTELDGLHEVIAHSVEDASPVRGGKFPILIFSHGYECYPAQNTALLERLASHGYIVLSIAHVHDATELRLANGTLLKTDHPAGRDEQFAALRNQFSSGSTHEIRTAALRDYPQALSRDRLGASFAAWRDDTLFVARALQRRAAPAALKSILKNADTRRLGLIGMSFGGATSASTCRQIEQCRVAVNLDGGNYDPALFNASAGRPLLLVMSDWIHLPQPGRLADPDFAVNDYSYEPWARAGLDDNVVRVRLEGIRHMGFTDLILLMDGPERESRFGTIAPETAVDAIGAASLAFLNQYLKDGSRQAFDKVLQRLPVLRLHSPTSVRNWAQAQATPVGNR